LPNVWQFWATLPIQIEKWFQSFWDKATNLVPICVNLHKKKNMQGVGKRGRANFGFCKKIFISDVKYTTCDAKELQVFYEQLLSKYIFNFLP
jgi:hypothetical protein